MEWYTALHNAMKSHFNMGQAHKKSKLYSCILMQMNFNQKRKNQKKIRNKDTPRHFSMQHIP